LFVLGIDHSVAVRTFDLLRCTDTWLTLSMDDRTLSALTSLLNNYVLLRICLSESGYNFLF